MAADPKVMAVPPQFERTAILIGPAGVAHLAAQHVFLAGLGGVGSWCAEALARAGIGHLTLVDHDVVAASNINRQLPALLNTVGQPKAQVLAERIHQINPDCRLHLRETFIQPDNVADLLPDDTNWVVDCIDSLSCKVALIATAYRQGKRIAASMGAGNKLDPGRVRLADISQTHGCPLGRQVRKRLRRQDIQKGILTVFSDEPGRSPLAPEPTSQGRPRAVNGTISYLPALFGLMLAGGVIQRMLDEIGET